MLELPYEGAALPLTLCLSHSTLVIAGVAGVVVASWVRQDVLA